MARTLTTVLIACLVILAGCAGTGTDAVGENDDIGDGAVGDGDGAAGGGDGADGTGSGDAAASAAEADGERIGYSVGGAKDVNNFRDNVENGYLPVPSDVTTEGLFYDYYFDTGERERCTELFCPSYSTAVTEDPLSGETEHYVTVGLNSGIEKRDFERKKLNLVIVLDTSGSMSESFDQYYYDDEGKKRETEQRPKMRAARESVLALTDQLNADDRFGVVTYDSGARTVLEMDRVGDRDMDEARRRVQALTPGGGTNLDAGMRKAREMVRPHADADPTEYETRVVYVTDAMPNLGDTSAGGLGDRLQRDAEDGIHSTFVGVGVDFNTRFVESVSTVEGANHYSVHSAAQFERRMGKNFEYMVTPLVFDLSLRLESEGWKIKQVYGAPQADAATGELLQVNTLFPSNTSDGKTKGGVILVKLERVDDDADLRLTAGYENRVGEEFENTKSVAFDRREPEHFDNTGIRKAVLLARYAALMQNWLAYERRAIAGDSPEEPADGIDEGGATRDLGKWERTSEDLRVSPAYADRIAAFERYFEREAAAIGDDDLEREELLLERLANHGADGGESGQSGSDGDENDQRIVAGEDASGSLAGPGVAGAG